MKVVFHYDVSPALGQRFAELAGAGAGRGAGRGLEIAHCPEHDEASFTALIGDAEVLWHVLKPVTAAVIAAAPRLRLIQKIGVGVNTIDLDAAKARRIKVCNMPGTNSSATAEMALLLMLATLRNLPVLDRTTRRGEGWTLPTELPDRLGELRGRTVGLVGYGAVPRCLAPILRAMGATVLYTRISETDDGIGRRCELPELLAHSDVVSLHVPLTAATTGMIDGAALAAMKPDAILINTARGGLVDQDALVAALANGSLRAAGLDVFADEPVEPENPLLALDNVVLMPHLSWLTTETLARSIEVAVENCQRIAAGRDLLHRVV